MKEILAITVYKVSPETEEMNQDDASFYLAVSKRFKDRLARNKKLVQVRAVCVNKFNGLMKTMFQKVGIKKDRL